MGHPYKLWKDSCLIFNLAHGDTAEGIEDVCVTSFDQEGIEDSDALREISAIMYSSWQTYTDLHGYGNSVHDYIKWHNKNYSRVKIGFVYLNQIPGSPGNY